MACTIPAANVPPVKVTVTALFGAVRANAGDKTAGAATVLPTAATLAPGTVSVAIAPELTVSVLSKVPALGTDVLIVTTVLLVLVNVPALTIAASGPPMVKSVAAIVPALKVAEVRVTVTVLSPATRA